ncbi:MAG: hypothetical protein ACRDBH_07195 [Bosea sp. (in: a-proteobacteria)]
MPRTKYGPTDTPGQTRLRCRYLGIWNPLKETPRADILEQVVIRTEAGTEDVLKDLPALTVAITDLAEVVAVVDPRTDEPTGATTTVGAIHALIHSWVRHEQAKRDAAEAARAAAPVTDPLAAHLTSPT